MCDAGREDCIRERGLTSAKLVSRTDYARLRRRRAIPTLSAKLMFTFLNADERRLAARRRRRRHSLESPRERRCQPTACDLQQFEPALNCLRHKKQRQQVANKKLFSVQKFAEEFGSNQQKKSTVLR